MRLSSLSSPEKRVAALISDFNAYAETAATLPLSIFGVSLTAIREGKAPSHKTNLKGDCSYHLRGGLLYVYCYNWKITIAPTATAVTGFDYTLLLNFWLQNPKLFRHQPPVTFLAESLQKLHQIGTIVRRDAPPFTNLLFATHHLLFTVNQWRSLQS